MTDEQPVREHRLGGARAYVVWLVGLLAYVVAVFHRSSLGVTGVEAAQRLGAGPGLLSSLAVAQLAVYAAMQVPVGVMLDRFGSKRLLFTGGVLMITGQLMFAVVHSLPLAVGARVLIGVGDAMTFISVLRVVTLWFPPPRNPLIVQLTGVLGQTGALVSAAPLVIVMHRFGWTTAFSGAALVGAVVTLLVLTVLADSPFATHPRTVAEPGAIRAALAAAWHEPGTRLGLWTHFVTPFSATAFLLLWGYPYLVSGHGLSPQSAGWLLSAVSAGSIVVGPLLGHLVAGHPFHRSSMVLAIVVGSGLAWGVVLLWPGAAPLWLLVVLVAVLAVGGPGSMIGFDFARTFNPAQRIGSASGIVNVGGFVASLSTVAMIGIVLDLLTPSGTTAYALDDFRWALAVQYPVWLLGGIQVIRYRRQARRRMAQLSRQRS